MRMSHAYQIQATVGIITGVIIAGAWWCAALRLASYWILYALAMVATLLMLFSAAISFLVQSRTQAALLPAIAQVQILLRVLDATLYVVFAGWLVSRCGQQTTVPGSMS
jgi:hypothetical protein